MFYRVSPEHDVERNLGAVAEQEDLNFDDPSWIIDHHRRNLIVKISKSENSLFEALGRLGRKRPLRNTEAHNNQNHNDQAQEKSEDNQQPGPNMQRPVEAPNYGRPEETEQSYRINLSELQRLRLRQLQHKLVQHVVDLRYDATEPSGWADDLRQYVQALQDYDYMGQHIRLRQDPFYVTGERFIDRCMLQVAMKDKENEIDPLRCVNVIGKWETADTRPDPISGTRDKNFRQSWIKGFRNRLAVAIVGGIFLIVPMWLMVLRNTLYTALVSTTVFVATFGLVMALFLDRLMDVMSSTAAYAAVLVVFVGLRTS